MADSQLFEQTKAYLLKASKDGVTLYDHLAETLLRLAEEQPENSVEKFEEISMQVKQQTFSAPGKAPSVKSSVFTKAEDAVLKQTELLYKPAPPPVDPETGEPQEAPEPNDGTTPNIQEQLYYLQQCGVGFSQEESFRIALAMRRLVEKEQVTSARFFGKILGQKADYVIAEATFKEGEHPSQKEPAEEEAPAEDEGEDGGEPRKKEKKETPAEAHGAGSNKFAYFVCSFAGQAGGAWTLLPDVTPQQLIVARQLKRYFTGDLEAKVDSYPPFPGVEKNLLRAQIARIVHATSISPKGFIFIDGDDAGEGDAPDIGTPFPEFEALDAETLESLDGWRHHVPEVLQQQARVEFYKEEPEEGAEEAAEEEPQEESKPAGSALSEDSPILSTPAWTVLKVNKLIPQYPVVAVRSNRWPGAYSFATDGGKKTANIYVGWGYKFTGQAYNPPLPPPVVADELAADVKEIADPTADDEQAFDKLDEEARLQAEAKVAAGGDDDGEDED
eukprot:TRINITY_DN6276_c0_g1_i1.p1 TRINITY_DN6276_c0_g1~~TRINITY_DN6276_c0_g1_i1.p1  ORF type:complete len:502 (-),score=140.89 TRINITY_DN6276_c0_g1_i1:62-1567(-)